MIETRLSIAERSALALIAVGTLLLALLVPPFQVPDEPQHFSRTVALARGAVFAEHLDGRVGALLPHRFADLSERDFPRELFGTPVRYSSAQIAAAMRLRSDGNALVYVEFANVANYAPTLYVPQAIAVAIGDGIGLPPLASFYLARVFNALTAIALVIAAVAVMPFGRLVVLAVAGLPTVAYHAGSVSPDATLNGLAFLVTALALRAGFGARVAPQRWLLLASAPLGLCKGLYAPLVLAGVRPGRFTIGMTAFIVAAAAFVAWTMIAGGDQAVYQIVSRRTGALVTTVPLSVQLHVVLADPVRYLRVLLSSMAERSPVYALQIVGRFGWNAILLPLFAYPLAAAMLLAAIFASGGVSLPRLSRLWWLMLAVGIACLIETALYLTGTPLAADYIQGSQGRYFLPVLPLIGLAAISDRFAASTERPGRFVVIVIAVLQVTAVLVVVDSFWVHGFVTYKGLPPIEHGSAALRSLILPSPRW